MKENQRLWLWMLFFDTRARKKWFSGITTALISCLWNFFVHRPVYAG
jgi:hypothetical protein